MVEEPPKLDVPLPMPVAPLLCRRRCGHRAEDLRAVADVDQPVRAGQVGPDVGVLPTTIPALVRRR
jgi:hypothetical protein